MNKADVIKMVGILQVIPIVDETGLMHLGTLDRYAQLMGTSEEEADGLIDDALELMIEDGEVTEHHGSYYMTEAMEEWAEEEKRQREEWNDEQYVIRQSYGINIGM